MGAWWYVRPRLHAAIRFHLRREAWQARAASSPPRPAAAAEAEAEAGLWGYGESEADATSGARLSASRPEVEVIYIGRPPAASPATASFRWASDQARPRTRAGRRLSRCDAHGALSQARGSPAGVCASAAPTPALTSGSSRFPARRIHLKETEEIIDAALA